MKNAIVFLLAVGIAVVLATLITPKKEVVISEFIWSVSRKTAPYAFSIANQTDKELAVVVVLEAHRVIQGRDGSKLHPLGLARHEVSLTGRETKNEAGVIELLDFGNSETRVSFHAFIKEPN